MFTLPFDQDIKHQTVLGKKEMPSTWKLKIQVKNGYWADEQWQPGNPTPVQLWAQFNDATLFDQTTSEFTFETEFEDTVHPQHSQLKLGIVNSEIGPISIQWKVWVENIDVTELMIYPGAYHLTTGETKHGTRCAGETGYHVLPIYTPVYVWLMQNSEILTRSI